jgi:hypothetical protein
VRGHEEERRALRARIVALRSECEVRVERVRRRWERDWEIERGEVAVVVNEGVSSSSSMVVGSDSGLDWEDADGEMEIEMAVNNAPTETSSSCCQFPTASISTSTRPENPTAAAAVMHGPAGEHSHCRGYGHGHASGIGIFATAGRDDGDRDSEARPWPPFVVDDDERGPWPGEAHTGTSTGRRRSPSTIVLAASTIIDGDSHWHARAIAWLGHVVWTTARLGPLKSVSSIGTD